MNKKGKHVLAKVLLVLMTSSLVSCHKKESAITIDLTNQVDSVCLLSEIADSISYYPIILEKGSRMPRYIEFIDNKIWVNYYLEDLSDEKADLYSLTDAELINSTSFGPLIGAARKYVLPSWTNTPFVFADKDRYLGYSATNAKKKAIYTFDVNTGKVLDEFHFPIRELQTSEPIRINESSLLVANDFTLFQLKKLVRPYSTIRWYDNRLQLVKEETIPDSAYFSSTEPFISLLDDKAYLHGSYTSTIYEISQEHSPKPVYQYHSGRFAPDFTMIDSLAKAGKLEEIDSLSCYHIYPSKISDNYIFGKYDFCGNRHLVLFDRRTHQVWVVQSWKTTAPDPSVKGIKNDLDGGLDFWPDRISKQGEIYACYNVKELKSEVAQSNPEAMKNPKASKRLKEMLDNLPEEANVIVAVLKEKK